MEFAKDYSCVIMREALDVETKVGGRAVVILNVFLRFGPACFLRIFL